MSYLSDPDRLERLAKYVLDVPPNATMSEVSEAMVDAAERIRWHQAELAKHVAPRGTAWYEHTGDGGVSAT